MVAVEDYLDALNWAESVGGLKGLIRRSNDNLKALGNGWKAAGLVSWPGRRHPLQHQRLHRRHRSSFVALADDAKADAIKKMCALLKKKAWRWTSRLSRCRRLRIWCGARWTKPISAALLDWAGNSSRAEGGVMAFIAENELEKALLRAGSHRRAGHRLLLDPICWCGTIEGHECVREIHPGAGQPDQAGLGQKNGVPFLPVFSSLTRMGLCEAEPNSCASMAAPCWIWCAARSHLNPHRNMARN